MKFAKRPFSGKECWYIADGGIWFRCKIVESIKDERKKPTFVLEPTTGKDSKGLADWPFPKQIFIRAGTVVGRTRVRHHTETPP